MVLFPETRFEAFLAKIAGESGPDLEPITRTEAFLDDIAGAGHDLEPRTRLEYWLQKIAERPSGGVDLSALSTDISQNTLGGLFQAFMNGTWGTRELSVASGTTPITVDFGRTIKGFICYPKNTTVPSGLTGGANTVVQIDVFNEPTENGQALLYGVGRTKGDSDSTIGIFSRIASWTFIDGLLSLVPNFPGNEAFHPFGFNRPYTFVYWW